MKTSEAQIARFSEVCRELFLVRLMDYTHDIVLVGRAKYSANLIEVYGDGSFRVI